MLGHHRHASETPFKWRFAGGSLMARLSWYLDPLSPHQKNYQSWSSSGKTFWIRACLMLGSGGLFIQQSVAICVILVNYNYHREHVNEIFQFQYNQMSYIEPMRPFYS